MAIAQVVIINKYADLDRFLDYSIPAEMNLKPGYRVKVPLGSRTVEGIVLRISSNTDVDNVKQVLEIIDSRLSEEFAVLARWMSIKSGCTLAAALSAMLPPPPAGNPLTRWQLNEELTSTIDLTVKQRQVVEFLRNQDKPLLKSEIIRPLGISHVPVNKLIEQGAIVEANPPEHTWPFVQVDTLTAEQAAAVKEIEEATEGYCQGAEFLLHGVTGSGKTEVYIRLAQGVHKAGRQVLILVPEIALTAQLVARFKTVFRDKVSVLHSGLNNNVRAADWENISSGKADLVIGTRSAVFAPLKDIGLIIMDEEHEPAFKQEETPRYHARDIALFRAKGHRAAVVLGSATPSLESYARAQGGRYKLLQLPYKIHNERRVAADLVDMRRELQEGNRDILSRDLQRALLETLARNEQAILFLNRRGVAPTVLCRNCGFRYSCLNCSTALTLHRNGELRCHHCGLQGRKANTCPQCGSEYLREMGLGTQKLETRLAAMFPETSILRLDRDTAASADAKEQQLYRFYQEGAGIMIGTQMIAKGLDFPNVTLVGIVLADLSLGMTDFRAAERTFQLVTQAAGRTGRADKPGKVIIQTYQPEHYSLRFALTGDYQGFYQHEMQVRHRAGMPPYAALTRILVSTEQENELVPFVTEISGKLRDGETYELLYSGPPPLEKLKGRYRWHFLLRHPGTRAAWLEIDGLRQQLRASKHCRVIIDNNPYNFM